MSNEEEIIYKQLIEQKIKNNRNENFEQIREIGKGAFGVVYEVRDKITNDSYAIKWMEMQNDLKYNLRELIISDLDKDYVVNYHEHWVEEQHLFHKIQRHLFIRMELCSMNLMNVIGMIEKSFYQVKDGRKSLVEENYQIFIYFISCELLKELTECVHYLHSLPTPIIHRDLNPNNILICFRNKRFLKLCDFGLAKEHQTSNHTKNMGNPMYIAPEVLEGQKYNLKCDIYSLALVVTQLFNFGDSFDNIKRPTTNLYKYMDCFANNKQLEGKCRELSQTLADSLYANDYHKRPDSQEFLKRLYLFSIDKSLVKVSEELLGQFKVFLECLNNEFMSKFFDIKIFD